MLTAPLYPLRFKPILKELIWGGRRLETVLHKPLGSGSRYAESWELADHREDVSRVADGPLSGASLRDLVRERGPELLGPALGSRTQFPLLVKFLDAHQVLSVQVHPDDERGRRLARDNGKTETWVVIHAEPGSVIYAGLRTGVTHDDFATALLGGEVEPLLHRFKARAGDCILIPAGTVHAIGAGVVLAEIQQMSDATFRIHDWGRLGPGGKPRQLHLAEALESIDFAAGPVNPLSSLPEPIAGGTRERLAACPFFALERLRLGGPATVGTKQSGTKRTPKKMTPEELRLLMKMIPEEQRLRQSEPEVVGISEAAKAFEREIAHLRLSRSATVGTPERFTILLGLGGATVVRCQGTETRLEFGRTLLLPAALGACELIPDGEAVVLTCVVP